MLIQSELAKAIETLTREGRMEISPFEASWIEEELENLLAHCHESAARAAREKKARHRYLAGLHGRSASTAHHQKNNISRLPNSPISPNSATIRRDWLFSKLTGRTPFRSTYESRTAVGTLVVRISVSHEGSDRIGGESRSLDICFSFIPRVDISTTGVLSRLCQRWEADFTAPRITRLVRAFNIVPDNSEAFFYAAVGNITALQKLFTEKKASLYDYWEDGWSLLMVCMLHSHPGCGFNLHSGRLSSVNLPILI